MTRKLLIKNEHRITNSKFISKINNDIGYSSININEFTYASNLEVMIDWKYSITSVVFPRGKLVVIRDNENGEKC